MNIAGLISGLPGPVKRGLVSAINSSETIRTAVSRSIINRFAYAAPIRPRPLSMAGEFTSWPGLTDRRYSGRHLGKFTDADAPAQPPMEDVVDLFRRRTFQPSHDSSLLFAFFAQWFTDGFLRTKWEEGPDREFRLNESNHEIDLCQIYGLTEVQTAMLRAGQGGQLRTQIIDGEEWPAPLFVARNGEMSLDPRFACRPGKDDGDGGTPGLYSQQNFERVFGRWTNEQKAHAFAVGLEHGNSTLGHTIMNALFVREHNRTAGILAEAHPDWSDERLFQTARNVTIAVLLNIVISDYIVHIAPLPIKLTVRPGMAERERWYRTNWMAVEFALLYRWHELIPEKLTIGDEELPADRFRKANGWMLGHGLDAVILACAAERAGRIGLFNTAHFLIERQDQGGADVKRLSISMDRACRLPSTPTADITACSHIALSPSSRGIGRRPSGSRRSTATSIDWSGSSASSPRGTSRPT